MSNPFWQPRRHRHSQISQQILARYILSVLGMIAVLVVACFLGWVVCRLFIWQPYEPLYRFLKAMEDTVFFWGGALILAGVFTAVYFFKVNVFWVILICGCIGFWGGLDRCRKAGKGKEKDA